MIFNIFLSMNVDNRKHGRVQGAWAVSQKRSLSVKNTRRPACQPGYLTKSVDNPQRKYVFEQPDEECQPNPVEIMITKAGIYDLSSEPSGISRLRFLPNFIDRGRSMVLHDKLSEVIHWHQNHIVIEGSSHRMPRLSAWFGDERYSYSGITHEANLNWPPVIKELRSQLEEVAGTCFNSLLCNLYRDGHDSVDWHSDNEPSLGIEPLIASLSFGDTRMFEMRKIPRTSVHQRLITCTQGQSDDSSSHRIVKMPLESGHLLIMEGATQMDWQHRVPKEYHDRGPRINLTFRVIHPVRSGPTSLITAPQSAECSNTLR